MTSIDSLKPTTKTKVITLLEQAGFDTSDWYSSKGNPATNPKYCYEWAFREEGVGVVLSLWHEECQLKDNMIIQKHNFRRAAKQHEKRKESSWSKRARRMDEAVRYAKDQNLPIRVILVSGNRRDIHLADQKASTVDKRELDDEFWSVNSYDLDTGEVVLARGVPDRFYEDQFSAPPPENPTTGKNTATVNVYSRDRRIREWVLQRAKGKCEFCQAPGFMTNSGKIYLETHHIIPLSEDGADSVGNVIALCPNHHREAHYGVGSMPFRQRLLETVSAK